MVTFSESEVAAIQARHSAPKCESVTREVEQLHHPIIRWCMNQVPAVPYLNPRPDRASTITRGAQDFTIFYKGRAICVECKTASGKRSPEQIDWMMLMERQGFAVHIVTTMQQFYKLISL